MGNTCLTLKPGGVGKKNGWVRLNWSLEGFIEESFVLSHELSEPDSHFLGDTERGDHALVAVLLLAMQQNKNIIVRGKVSPRLLDGLETLQVIWNRWRPYRYKIISIKVDEESEAVPAEQNSSAIFAFSGGVDASFSLFRHLKGQAGRNTYRPGAAIMVHGMDIPLNLEDFYYNATIKTKRMLKGTGVPLIQVRTNSRFLRQNWEDSYGLQLAACFLLLQENFFKAVKGSGEPYEALVFPWGSTPLTDSLCSTDAMQFEHDGCGFDRTEKIGWLVKNTNATSELRVCWAGQELDKNCGECEKCVRTMLNFWALGLPVPEAFPVFLDPKRVKSIKIKNVVQKNEISTLYKHAVENHAKNDPILKAVGHVIGEAGSKALFKKFVNASRQLIK